MDPSLMMAGPRPYTYSGLQGRFGVFQIPPPPQGAEPRQVMDHAATVAFGKLYQPFRDGIIGVSELIERTALAYLSAYHPDQLPELYTPDTPTDEDPQ